MPSKRVRSRGGTISPDQTANELSVAELRAALVKLGLPTVGTKADLVKRYREAAQTVDAPVSKKPKDVSEVVQMPSESADAEAEPKVFEDLVEDFKNASTNKRCAPKRCADAAAALAAALEQKGDTLSDDQWVLGIQVWLEHLLADRPRIRDAAEPLGTALMKPLAAAAAAAATSGGDDAQFRRWTALFVKTGNQMPRDEEFSITYLHMPARPCDGLGLVCREVNRATSAMRVAVNALLDAGVAPVTIMMALAGQNGTELAVSVADVPRMLRGSQEPNAWRMCLRGLVWSQHLTLGEYRAVAENMLGCVTANHDLMHGNATFIIALAYLLSPASTKNFEGTDEMAALRAEYMQKFKAVVETPENRDRFFAGCNRGTWVMQTLSDQFFAEERVAYQHEQEEEKKREEEDRAARKARISQLLASLHSQATPEISFVCHHPRATTADLLPLVDSIGRDEGFRYHESQYSVTTVAVLTPAKQLMHYSIVMERFEDTPSGAIFEHKPNEDPYYGKRFIRIRDDFDDVPNDNEEQTAWSQYMTGTLSNWWYAKREGLPAGPISKKAGFI